jgi:hypothetical protein
MTLSAAIALLAVGLQTPVRQAPTVEVPFRLGDDAIIVDANVNGRTVSLMFDTGYGGSVIVDSGINVGPRTGSQILRDFVGKLEAPTVKIRSLALGSKKIDTSGMEVVQLPTADYSMSYNTHVNGIIGFEVIKNYVTEINFQRNRFIFYPRTTDITKRKPDGKRTFLARLLPLGHSSMEMEVVASTGKKMVLALDTGNAFYATTHKEVLERVGVWEANRKPDFMKLSMVASGPVESFYKRLKNINIYGVPVSDSVWSIIDLPKSDAEGDGTVGFQFLKNFNITIDYERRRVWLENFTGTTGNELPASVGISAFPDPRLKRVVVTRVSPAGPAHNAGIKEGDHLLSIDGKPVSDVGFRRLEKLLEGEPGSKVRLALSRNGVLQRYEVERVRLVNE